MKMWVQISAAKGAQECGWVVARLLPVFEKEAESQGLVTEVLEIVPWDSDSAMKSVLLSLSGPDPRGFLSAWEGTVQWIGQSSYRPHHKRKNWYVGIRGYAPTPDRSWDLKEIRVETCRSSGPGGQHVNKTESAVRVVHIPSGVSAQAREERSQHANHQLALARLAEKLEEQQQDQQRQQTASRWAEHSRVERGNPVRVYRGDGFKRAR